MQAGIIRFGPSQINVPQLFSEPLFRQTTIKWTASIPIVGKSVVADFIRAPLGRDLSLVAPEKVLVCMQGTSNMVLDGFIDIRLATGDEEINIIHVLHQPFCGGHLNFPITLSTRRSRRHTN